MTGHDFIREHPAPVDRARRELGPVAHPDVQTACNIVWASVLPTMLEDGLGAWDRAVMGWALDVLARHAGLTNQQRGETT